MSEDYSACSYRELQRECRARGINGKGSREELTNRLVADDLALTANEEGTDQNGHSLSPSYPNPANPNYDFAGRWIRKGADGRPLHKAYRDKNHPAYKNFDKLRQELGDV